MLDISSSRASAPPPMVRVSEPAAKAAPAAASASAPAQATESARIATAPLARPQINVDTERDQRRLQQAISQLNTAMRDGGRGLNFQVDPSLNQPVVTVTNQETGEVIRQIPSEVVVRIARNIDNAKGYLLNARV